MRHVLFLGLLWALAWPFAVGAGPFDGLYRPNYDWALAWDCTTVGVDGGALAVENDTLTAVDNSCTLSDPVEVRDMEAVLYDAECSGDGGASAGRIMLMAHDFGLYVIRDGFVLDWIRCGEAG